MQKKFEFVLNTIVDNDKAVRILGAILTMNSDTEPSVNEVIKRTNFYIIQ